MYTCKLFVHTCSTLPAFVRHMRIHIHVANVRFNCALPACNKSFKKCSAFKTHCYQHRVNLCHLPHLNKHVIVASGAGPRAVGMDVRPVE